MKKKLLIITVLLVVIMLVGMGIRTLILNKYKKDQMNCINEELLAYEKTIEGMKVTLIGGSNMEDKGNINSMGYIIRTRNDELILVDGGRDVDADLIKFYIDKYGEGKVDHWFITHPHNDHVGALNRLLALENNLEIENIYYSFLEDEWYKENDERGYDSSHTMLERITSSKIKNRVECKAGQVIEIDNLKVDIIRIPNPEITNSDNGNEASMVFKVTATDVDKSLIFLGDAYNYCSKELLEMPEKLKADAVQMAHHGQNGATKEVYEAISPSVCLFNIPKYLYENDNGEGYNSGPWETVIVRGWVDELGATIYKSFEGDQILRFTSEGIKKIEE